MGREVEFDVAVVGAGPAGASAAHALAAGGARVVLLERETLPRHKTCGGGLVGRALRFLPFSVESVVERSCHAAVVSILDGDLEVTVRRATPLIAMTMRDRFDAFLVENARAAGAEVVPGREVRDVRAEDGHVALSTAEGTVRGRFLVAADGALGTVARKAGWTERAHLIPALESELAVPDAVFDRYRDVARFDFGLVPHGYAWVFPKARHLSVGVLTTRRGAVNLHRALDDYRARLGLEDAGEEARHGFVIPIVPRRGDPGRGRVLLTGDVAGLADPVTAEGISHAIRSGQLAARAILEAGPDPEAVVGAYRAALRSEILDDLRVGRWLGRILYDFPALRLRILRRWGDSLARAMADVFAGERDYRQVVGRLLPLPGLGRRRGRG